MITTWMQISLSKKMKVPVPEHGPSTAAESPLLLLVVCKTPSLRGLRPVKEYVANINLLRRTRKLQLPSVGMEAIGSLSEAIRRASDQPDTSIVLVCGYPTNEIQSALSEQPGKQSLCIISHPSADNERFHTPTASLFEQRVVTRVRNLNDGVHKAILRLATRNMGELRVIKYAAELEQYFSLRYQIWNEMGYIPAESGLDQNGWEIDCFDRFSIPIGFFSNQDGLVACARLVHQYGREKSEHVKAISRLLNSRGSEASIRAFSYKGTAEQPFDILCEFRGFREYYRNFIQKQLAIAEASRIIVIPKYRGQGLAEVIVDSLISLAKVQSIDVLTLACREALSPLYQRCGFLPVPNLVSEKFLSIPEKSIVMEHRLIRGKKLNARN